MPELLASDGEGFVLQTIDCYAQVAQSVEHVLGKDEVGGSIPLLGFAVSRSD